jgi:hypothetical protein
VHVQIGGQTAGQTSGQTALTGLPRRLTLGVPPRTGTEQFALPLKEIYGRGAEEGKKGIARVPSILRSATAESGRGPVGPDLHE